MRVRCWRRVSACISRACGHAHELAWMTRKVVLYGSRGVWGGGRVLVGTSAWPHLCAFRGGVPLGCCVWEGWIWGHGQSTGSLEFNPTVLVALPQHCEPCLWAVCGIPPPPRWGDGGEEGGWTWNSSGRLLLSVVKSQWGRRLEIGRGAGLALGKGGMFRWVRVTAPPPPPTHTQKKNFVSPHTQPDLTTGLRSCTGWMK